MKVGAKFQNSLKKMLSEPLLPLDRDNAVPSAALKMSPPTLVHGVPNPASEAGRSHTLSAKYLGKQVASVF